MRHLSILPGEWVMSALIVRHSFFSNQRTCNQRNQHFKLIRAGMKFQLISVFQCTLNCTHCYPYLLTSPRRVRPSMWDKIKMEGKKVTKETRLYFISFAPLWWLKVDISLSFFSSNYSIPLSLKCIMSNCELTHLNFLTWRAEREKEFDYKRETFHSNHNIFGPFFLIRSSYTVSLSFCANIIIIVIIFPSFCRLIILQSRPSFLTLELNQIHADDVTSIEQHLILCFFLFHPLLSLSLPLSWLDFLHHEREERGWNGEKERDREQSCVTKSLLLLRHIFI